MAHDKLSIINRMLPLTGNALVSVPDDGSDEWTVASAAYDAGADYLIGEHNWNFATAIDTMPRANDSPDEKYADAYNKPANALSIVWVRVGGLDVDYRIIGNQICVNEDEEIQVKYVVAPGPEDWPPLFVKAMEHLVKAGCYEGLNEDKNSADKEEAKAEVFLARARTRADREEPARVGRRSGTLTRRRTGSQGARS